ARLRLSHRHRHAWANFRGFRARRHTLCSAHPDSSSRIKPRGETMAETCTHTDQIRHLKPKVHVCEECVKMGDTWVHLRLGEIWRHVGCCDSSKNKHAPKHFHPTKHPIVQSIEPGEDWYWCYIHEVMFEEG